MTNKGFDEYNKFIGAKFGALTIKGFYSDYGDGHKRVYANCICDCGNELATRFDHMKTSSTISCGCKRYANMAKKHGCCKTRLYRLWQGIKSRCYNAHNPEYKNYGGRGIIMSNEWLDFSVFKQWADSNGYADNLTIERVNVNGNYCKENCKWIPLSEQLKNTTRTVYITYKGETLCAQDWCKKFGLANNVVIHRYRTGLPLDKVFSKKTFRGKSFKSKEFFNVTKS